MKKIIISLLVVFSFSLDIKKAYYESYNYEKMGDYKDAIRVLIPIYEKFKSGYTINLRLGYLFFLNKNYQNAIKHYQKASLVLPYSIEAKLGLARVYLAMGKFNKVIEISNVILKEDFYNYYGNYYLIEALINSNKLTDALKITNKMLILYPTSVLFLTKLGEIYFKQNKKDLAKKIFNNIIILDPTNLIAKRYLK